MKRLNKDQKASVLLAARDAVFQQIADREESIVDEAAEEALRAVRRFEDDDDMWDAVQCKVQDEIKAIFNRIYDAIKKGDDQK